VAGDHRIAGHVVAVVVVADRFPQLLGLLAGLTLAEILDRIEHHIWVGDVGVAGRPLLAAAHNYVRGGHGIEAGGLRSPPARTPDPWSGRRDLPDCEGTVCTTGGRNTCQFVVSKRLFIPVNCSLPTAYHQKLEYVLQ